MSFALVKSCSTTVPRIMQAQFASPLTGPPVTLFRPLHTLIEADKALPSTLLTWSSSFGPCRGEDVAVQAFVRLVSLVAIVDQGEPFCIQDTTRGGYVWARAGDNHRKDNYSFVPFGANKDEIPTDFSIGPGKALQFEAVDDQIRLSAKASIISQPGLDSLGQMLEDIILGWKDSTETDVIQWTRPSVLNFPPQDRPVLLWPRESQATQPVLLHHWFERRAKEFPQRIALDYLTNFEKGGRRQYTYQDVANAATALATALHQASSKSSAVVRTIAVVIGPCPELYISYLAALKAGLAFCPIPVDAPDERKRALLADLEPVAVLVEKSGRIDTTADIINVSGFLEARNVEPEPLPCVSASENDAAYILYTSGTTGMPKGVVVSHISAACTISALSNHYGLFSLDTPTSGRPVRWFQGAAPTFDISIFEIFWTLSTGSTLCCAPRHLTMQNVDGVVAALNADITNVTPSFASLINPSLLHGLIVGGETLNTRLLQDFSCYNPETKDALEIPRGIYNGYGPTEVTIYSIAQAHVPATQRGSVIGSPISTCATLIVDERSQALEPVPAGATGELVLTGPQVSKMGYLNRPEETAKSFIDDEKYGRAYRTGDRARIVWSEQGQPVVEFLGRMSDDQVKLSGRRVELGEIEGVLASKVQSIQQMLACLWNPRNGTSGSERVVSLVVVDPKSTLSFETVQSQCVEAAQRHLPDYMRPVRIIQVETLPRSTSGKVDRKAALVLVRSHLQELPKNEHLELEAEILGNTKDAQVEAELVKILCDVNGDNSITASLFTATTPLIHVGVDSLRAMRLLHEIRKKWPGSQHLQPPLNLLLGPEATVRSVFFPSAISGKHATGLKLNRDAARKRIADFASRNLAECLAKLDSVTEPDIEMILPATSTQSQLAVSFGMDRRNYISHTILPLKADVLPDALESAVNYVLQKHAIYRCAFVPCDDGLSPFAQVVFRPDAWRRWTGSSPRVVRRQEPATSDVQPWLQVAQKYLDLDLQRLYYVQIIHEDNESAICAGLLVISLAHCLCDGASTDVLLSDISKEYSGLSHLPRISIEDTVLDWVSSLSIATDKYWQESLRGWEAGRFYALSGHNIKLAAPGVPADYGHAMVQFTSSLQWRQLESRSRNLGVSPLAVLQASWSLLLKIFSEANTEDVVFGSVLSGHNGPAHCPNFSVLPCRVPLPDVQTVQELTNFLVNSSRFARGHHHLSFGIFKTLPYNTALALQAYSPPDAGLGEVQDGGSATPWTEVRHAAIRYDFDIFAEVIPVDPISDSYRSGGILFKLTYRDDVLSEISANVIVKQFALLTEVLLDSKADDLVHALPARLPKTLLSAEGTIPVPTKNATEKEYQITKRIEVLHAQFENQATATPDLLALSFYMSLDIPPIELTYNELDTRANGLANILRQEDMEIIPICMQRSVELYVSVLAILKAGSAWSPIDETSPIQRRTSLIARTQGKVLLTTTDSFHLVEPCLSHESLVDVRVILVDQFSTHKTSLRAEPRHSIRAARSTINGQDLAYLLWTSGTTGEPKGVMVQHHAAANAMRDLQMRVGHNSGVQVRTLQLSSYSFDVFVQDLFYTWGLAGIVVSGTREIVLGTFTELVNKSRPTHAHLTPSFGASINMEEIDNSTLEYITFIGEKLTEDVAEAWAAQETRKAYNTYGPAENAVVSTMRRFFGRSRDQAKAANVGFPLAPCTAYVVREVVDPNDAEKKRWELVPRYGVGELALGGAQLAKGYLNNEAKTTKAFIRGGGPHINERIYLTGDVVRLNDHGFEFLGRNDDLVKIAGIRMELSEISAACALVKTEEPTIEHVETLYLPRPGVSTSNATNKVLVSFVSVKKEGVDTTNIRMQVFQKARELLPAYMVPAHVVVLDTTMPRTASNKVDRRALQNIYDSSDLDLVAGRDTAGGNGAIAEVRWSEDHIPLVKAIAESFNIALKPLNPNDSLAGLGFNSLQVTKLAWALRRQMKCTVGVVDLMRCQTLGELVDVVVQSLNKTQGSDVQVEQASKRLWISCMKKQLTKSLHGELRPESTSYILPCTPVQESLLVETMIEPGAYWSHRVFDLGHLGEIDVSRLKAAWTIATSHIDILRTVFVPLSQLSVRDKNNVNASGGKWAREHGVFSAVLQLILDKIEVQWKFKTSANTGSIASFAQRIQLDLTPMGTNAPAPPWAVTLFEDNKRMMLSMHHALHDGESSAMLLEIVANLYQSPEGAFTTYGSALQMEYGMELGLLPSISERDEAYATWSKYMHGLVETHGALNAPFPDLTGSRQKQDQKILSVKAAIPSHLLERRVGLPDLPRLMQSAFGCILAALLELRTIVLGHTVSQRVLHPDLAGVVGPAMATLPVVVHAHAPTAEELWVKMSRDAISLGRVAHSLHPVDIKKMINEGSGDENASFPALFVYHPAADREGDRVNSGLEMFHEVGQALSLNVEHPMALNIFEASNIIELTGDSRRISQGMLDLILEQVLSQARVMLDHPRAPLHQLNKYMGRELVAVVGELATFVGTDIARNPAELVTKQAIEHPNWIAVEEIFLQDGGDGGDRITIESITYAELEVLVNAIASRLTGHISTPQPDDVVALYLRRDTKSLAAIIAIFKCGYIYLPIDLGLPTARKQLLVRDANAKLVITTEGLIGDLDLDPENDPPAVILPEGDDELKVIGSWSDTVSNTPSRLGDGGYLLYTSGSTGRPKGVRVTNEGLLHYISAMTKRLIEANKDTGNLGGVGKYLNVASRAFDTHLTSMFAAWHLGFRSAIGKDRDAIFASLQHVINEVKITHMGSVPSILSQLGLRLKDVPSMRVLTFGGEKASHDLFEQLNTGNPDAVLMNFYGPTEVTVGCMSHTVGHHSNARNLGLPLPGLEALLLVPGDEAEQVLCCKGQPGELCIAGPQVAVGYLNRPEENAKGFQHTILLGGGKKRIYRTGDMMRMMHDGTVEFLGRKDQQTKIRGQRFEIGEVEGYIKKVVADQGAIDVAAAVVDQRLIGFLARKRDALLKAELDTEPELISYPTQALQSVIAAVERACQHGLPAFMVPDMTWVSKIPYLAVSGKTDAKLLIKMGNDFLNFQQTPHSAAVLSVAPVTALNDAENEIIAALEEVTGNKVIATSNSTLSSLGIDSLSGLHLLSALKKRGFGKVSLADLLASSCSVSSLSQAACLDITLDKPVKSTGLHAKEFSLKDLGTGTNNLDESNVAMVLSCMPLQSSLIALSLNWLCSDEGSSSADAPYVTEFNYGLAPGTDVARWKGIAEQVVFSEAMLRTCFFQREQDGQIFQVVLKSPPSLFDGEDDAATILSQMSYRPPLRLQCKEDQLSGRTTVSLKIHHALYDGAAITILKNNIEQAYVHNRQPASLETQSLITLRNISNYCNLTSEEIRTIKGAWDARIRGFQPCCVSTNIDEDKRHIIVNSKRRLTYTLADLMKKLQKEDRGSVSVSTAFQLATTLCLAYLTRGKHILYGFTMSLRPLLSRIAKNIDGFVGPCLNTIIHAVTLEDAHESLPQLAQRVYQGHNDALQGKMPLVAVDKVQRWAGVEERLFDSLLTINILPPGGEPTVRKDTPGHMESLPGKARIDMALIIDIDIHANGQINLAFASAGVLTKVQLEEIAALFERVVINSADSTALVEQFTSGNFGHDIKISNGVPRQLEPRPLSEDFNVALNCVRQTLCRLLRLKEIDIDESTSLYRLGLDSINVLPFVKLINKSEVIKISPNAVIRARTVRGVAELVYRAKNKSRMAKTDDHNGHNEGGEFSKAKSANVQQPYEQILQQVVGDLFFIATPLQEGMLSAAMAIADQAYTYTHSMYLSEVALAKDAPLFTHLFCAIKETVKACDILRTRFVFTSNDDMPWVGVILPTEQSDLVNWEVSKSGLVQLKIHHALYDGKSIELIWQLLNENYARVLKTHQEYQDDGEFVQYSFCHYAKSCHMAQKPAVAFWTKILQSYAYEPIELFHQSMHASSAFYFNLDRTDLSRLQDKCRQADVTPKTAMQLAWAKVLCETLYKQADVVFGEVITTNSDDDDNVVMGPTINTIPLRINFSSQHGATSIEGALHQLQALSDSSLGGNGMASLRMIQTAWRLSRADHVNTSGGLFQSLFVYDGIIDSDKKSCEGPLVPPPAKVRVDTADREKAPSYDDYPLIVSFRIKAGRLHGALRAKMSRDETSQLGKQLEAALRYIVSENLQNSALGPAYVHSTEVSGEEERVNTDSVLKKITDDSELSALTDKAEAILAVAKKVLGGKLRAKEIASSTKLVNVGLDSISAIRFSKMLRKQLGIQVSIFEIIRGASTYDILKMSESRVKDRPHQQKTQVASVIDNSLKALVALKLGLTDNQIKSISHVLPGQRGTLQQWLHSGKRFFEAPWAYRITDPSIDAQQVTGYWALLCQAHEVLRTSFVYIGGSFELAQVTLESVSVTTCVTTIQDNTISVQDLIQKSVREGNSKASNLIEPPAHLHFLEASDGRAIILRVHHALYDAWSIKMIQKDLVSLFDTGSLKSHPSIQWAVDRINAFREPQAEQKYWKQYLAGAQDTIVESRVEAVNDSEAPLGPHFKAHYANILPQDVANTLATAIGGRRNTHVGIIVAYARALGRLTGRSRPTFGFNYSSRSLSSPDGEGTLDLTSMSIPTMTVVPLTVNLANRSEQQLLDAVLDHLAQLTKFAQADRLDKLSPRFNSYLNILYSEESSDSQSSEKDKSHVLQRHNLGEHLSSEYFTNATPPSIISTVDKLDTSPMEKEQFYFNVLIHQNGNISVNVSGDKDLLSGDRNWASMFVNHFIARLIQGI